jgi:hypothetical protein
VKDAYQGNHLIELELTVSGNVRMLRIDPAFDSCMVKIESMTFNGEEIPLKKRKLLLTNGRIVKPSARENYQPSIVFDTKDPNINIDLTMLERKAENIVTARMEIVRLPLEMAKDMAGAAKGLI